MKQESRAAPPPQLVRLIHQGREEMTNPIEGALTWVGVFLAAMFFGGPLFGGIVLIAALVAALAWLSEN